MIEGWVRSPKPSPALAQEAGIVLACAAGGTNEQVAAPLEVSLPAVAK